MADFTWKICRGFLDYNDSGYEQLLSLISSSSSSRSLEDTFLTDNHDDILYCNENEFDVENLIEKVETAWWDRQGEKLKAYMNANVNDYKKYIIKKLYYDEDQKEDQIDISMLEESVFNRFKDSYYINEYIEEENLIQDYHKFILSNQYLFTNVKSKDEIRKQLLLSVFNEILSQSSYKYIYVYRDRDRKSILITKI